jgi:hypothetical protein
MTQKSPPTLHRADNLTVLSKLVGLSSDASIGAQ